MVRNAHKQNIYAAVRRHTWWNTIPVSYIQGSALHTARCCHLILTVYSRQGARQLLLQTESAVQDRAIQGRTVQDSTLQCRTVHCKEISGSVWCNMTVCGVTSLHRPESSSPEGKVRVPGPCFRPSLQDPKYVIPVTWDVNLPTPSSAKWEGCKSSWYCSCSCILIHK